MNYKRKYYAMMDIKLISARQQFSFSRTKKIIQVQL